MGRYSLFLGFLLFLTGCAEVIPLTGGPADERAAVPVEGTQNPEQGALHVNQSQLTVKFNEFFTLNDPANTAVMNPNAGKLDVTSNKRDLYTAAKSRVDNELLEGLKKAAKIKDNRILFY